MKPSIRDKASPASATLGEVPPVIEEVPGPGYDTRPQWGRRGAVIAGVGHRDPVLEKLIRTSDHALAFRTLHAGMIQRSCNAKVRKAQDVHPA
jgi:hypothetical protein